MNNHFSIAESKLSYSEAATQYEKVFSGATADPLDSPYHPRLAQQVAVS